MKKQEGVEAVVDDELLCKSRTSSKRCRAAEVHNLSEKVLFFLSFFFFVLFHTIRLLETYVIMF